MLPIHLSTTTRSAIKILLFFIAIVVVQIKTPPVTNAQQSANNTAVFSGQFIPAFVGSAYDPTAAYQRMAGLPVYVFAYDSWGGASFIINNLAVRTQVRADGSFQVQGLPNGQKFGVYFPFRLLADGSAVERTDCYNGDTTVLPCRDSVLGPDVAFRMPQPDNNSDGILDVFSYNMADASALTSVYDQLNNQINLGLTFLTQETRVDIENNINTFPLVPTSAIRINVLPSNEPGLNLDGAYEVVVQRVGYTATSGVASTVPVSSPIIAGRTTFPREMTGPDPWESSNTITFFGGRFFQAYAPPGTYAVTVWMNTGGVAYNVFSGVVNSSIHGFAIYNNSGMGWEDALTVSREVVARKNNFVVWGRVINEVGNLSRINNVPIHINAESGRKMYPKQRPTTADGSGCDLHLWVYRPQTTPCLGDATGDTENFTDSFGLYAFYGEYFSPTSTAFVQDERFWVNFEEGHNVDPATTSSGTVLSTYGPVNIDLTRQPPPTSSTTTSGVWGKILPDPATTVTERPNPSGTRIKVRPAPPYDATTGNSPAFAKTYRTDNLGRVHIPANDLVLGTSYQLIVSHPLMQPQEIPFTYNEVYQPLGDIIQLSALPANATIKNDNKILGIIPANFLFPGPKGAIAADSYGTFVIQVYNATNVTAVRVNGPSNNPIYDRNLTEIDSTTTPITVNIPLGYTAADNCPAGDDAVCLDFLRESNIYNISLRADGKRFDKRVYVELPPGSTEPVVKDAIWNLNATDPCAQFEPDTTEPEETTDSVNVSTPEKGPQKEDCGWDAECHGRNMRRNIESTGETVSAVRQVVATLNEDGVAAAGRKIVAGLSCGATTTMNNLTGSAFNAIEGLLILQPLTISPGIVATWNALRAISNAFFVFILLVIGINHALGLDIKTWGANVLLPKLISSIILANLSLLIVQMILDINTILTSWMFAVLRDILSSSPGLAQGAVTGLGATAAGYVLLVIGQAIVAGISAGIGAAVTTGGLALPAILIGVMAGALLILSLVVFLLGMLFGRYLIIWLGVAIAPLAFAFSVLPWFSGMRKVWWSLILPVACMQTVIAGVLVIGTLLLANGSMVDNIFVKLGTILIGAGTLFVAIRSPQVTAVVLGDLGKGAGFQLLNKAASISNKGAGIVSGAASSLSQYATPQGLEEGLAQRKAENADIDARFGKAQGILGKAKRAIARPLYRAAISREDRLDAIKSQGKKKAMSQAGKPKPTTGQEVSESIDDSVLDATIMRENKIAPTMMEGWVQGATNRVNDTQKKFVYEHTPGSAPVLKSVPELMDDVMSAPGSGVSTTTQAAINSHRGAKKMSEFKKLDGGKHYAEFMKRLATAAQNNPPDLAQMVQRQYPKVDASGMPVIDPATGVQQIDIREEKEITPSISALRNEGLQRRREELQATPRPTPPAGGGGTP